MRAMEDIKEMLCEELEKFAEKGTLSMADLETVHKLTDTIKNIEKIDMYGKGYSSDGGWNASGTYTRDGGSYGGSYGRGRNYGRRYSRTGYSYGDDTEMLTEKLERMMEDGRLSADEKSVLKRAMDIIGK